MSNLTLSTDEINNIFKDLDENTVNMLSNNNIENRKKNILNSIVSDEDVDLYLEKLRVYRYVDEIDEMNIGSYIRWFNIKNPKNIKLTNGGFIIDMKYQNDTILLLCKNTINKIFTLKIEECIIFQKLAKQEELIIEILDYIKS